MSNMILTNTLDKSVTYPYNYPRYSVDYEILQGINYIFNALQYEYYCTIFSDNINCYIRTFSEYKYGSEIHPTINYNSLDDNVYLSGLLKYYPIYSEDREYLEKFNNLNIPTTLNQLTYNEIKDKINNNWSDFKTEFKISKWSENYYTVLKANGQVYAEYKNIEDAANAVNISTSIIQQEVLKDVKTLSGNFYWSYDKTLGETKNYNNLGKAKEVYQYDLNGKFINKYSSASQAARSLGVNNQSHISECCRGKIKTYKGFVWRYSEDIVLTSLKEEENACEA